MLLRPRLAGAAPELVTSLTQSRKPSRLSYHCGSAAGWSSLVARRAHNPKVAGSNPAPATSKRSAFAGLFYFPVHESAPKLLTWVPLVGTKRGLENDSCGLRPGAPGLSLTPVWRAHFAIAGMHAPVAPSRRRAVEDVAKATGLRNLDCTVGVMSATRKPLIRETSSRSGLAPLRRDEARDLEQRFGHRRMQLPRDLDRPLAAVFDERRRPEQREGRCRAVGEGRAFAHEEQDGSAGFALLAITTAGWTVGARGALGFPVEESRREGVVAVAG